MSENQNGNKLIIIVAETKLLQCNFTKILFFLVNVAGGMKERLLFSKASTLR